jgi:transposase
LWGAAKVEDTYNLLGHALKKALSVIARQQGRELTEIASQMDADLVAGSSLKAALDLNWDDPEEKVLALGMVLGVLYRVETHLDLEPETKSHPVIRSHLEAAQKIEAQDVEVDEQGEVKLRKGVAKNRRITIEDEQMRHGRKNRSKRFDGYKRHILKDLDLGMVRAVGITMANLPEASVTEAITVDLEHQKAELNELHIDRAYLSSSLVKNRGSELTVYCKAWRVSNGNKFAKSAFVLDWESETITCPNQVSVPFREGGKVQFPKASCLNCPVRQKCTTSKKGRSVSIHPDEKFIAELRERQLTPTGRAKLRERVTVEHSLSHIGHWQGDKARYMGVRKNLFDLRRTAVVHNLHVLVRLLKNEPELFASKSDHA